MEIGPPKARCNEMQIERCVSPRSRPAVAFRPTRHQRAVAGLRRAFPGEHRRRQRLEIELMLRSVLKLFAHAAGPRSVTIASCIANEVWAAQAEFGARGYDVLVGVGQRKGVAPATTWLA
jgi:hypothetical protein